MIPLINVFGNIEGWIFMFILVALVVLFGMEFDMRKGKSWAILFGVVALGGLMFRSQQKNKGLRKELKARKKALKELEEEYAELKEINEASDDMYEKAKAEREAAQNKTLLDIARANDKYDEEMKKMEEKIDNMMPGELAEHFLNNL